MYADPLLHAQRVLAQSVIVMHALSAHCMYICITAGVFPA